MNSPGPKTSPIRSRRKKCKCGQTISRIWLCWWWDAVLPGSIGSAIAQALADAGAALVLADLATSKLVAVGQQLVEQGHRVLTQAVDLVSENSVEELVSFAQKSFGRLDAVVNGCGRNQPSRSSSYVAPAVR